MRSDRTTNQLFASSTRHALTMNIPVDPQTSHHSSPHTTAREALQAIYRKSGLKGLWLGTPAGIAKTVPKYVLWIVGYRACVSLVKQRLEEGGGFLSVIHTRTHALLCTHHTTYIGT